MLSVPRSALGPSGRIVTNLPAPDLLKLVPPPVGDPSGPGASSSGGAWSNTTTIHTNDPASGRNESRVITESGHDHTVKPDLAVWVSVGAFVSVAVFVWGLWVFTQWRSRRSARIVALTLARINNPEGAAAERAAECEEEDLEAARRTANPRAGLLSVAGRWLRELLWDGLPKKPVSATPGSSQG